MKKVLLVGETWTKNITHIKGFDTFVTCHYEDASHFITNALKSGGYEVDHLAAHVAYEGFPKTLEELSKYSAVIFSDIGSNSLILSDSVFVQCKKANKCILELVKEYVSYGGSFLMVGGYMSFTGIDAKARFGETAIGDILPVEMLKYDDRVEKPAGIKAKKVKDHKAIEGVSENWPNFLGYNKTILKSSGEILVEINGDPLIACTEYQKGKTAVFTSDCAPHWGPQEFLEWESYSKMWVSLVDWMSS